MPVVERSNCPVCAKPASRELYACQDLQAALGTLVVADNESRIVEEAISRHFANATFDYRQCQSCRFVWQGFILDDSALSEVYSRTESAIAPDALRILQSAVAKDRGHRLALRVAQTLALSPKPITDTRVLDFGCGNGIWLSMAGAMGAEVEGIELSSGRREAVNRRGITCHASLADCNGPFDVIVCDQVLEHVANPLQELKNMVELLATDGVIFLGVPNGRRVPKALGATPPKLDFMPLAPFFHINSFTNASLKLLARNAGLEAVRPSHRFGHRLGLRGALKNLLASPWEFRTKASLHFRKA